MISDSSSLLDQIRAAIPRGFHPDESEDVVQDIAILVLEGRVNLDNLSEELRPHLARLRKQNSGQHFERSLDDPIGRDGSTLVRRDVVIVAPFAKHRCPICRKTVKPGRTYCSKSCVCRSLGMNRRKIDPSELRTLHLAKWMPTKKIAAALGATADGVSSAVRRAGLQRVKNPMRCRMARCDKPAIHFRHCRGHWAGNLCAAHRKEKAALYSKRSRERSPKYRSEHIPTDPARRKEWARLASLARWKKKESA